MLRTTGLKGSNIVDLIEKAIGGFMHVEDY